MTFLSFELFLKITKFIERLLECVVWLSNDVKEALHRLLKRNSFKRLQTNFGFHFTTISSMKLHIYSEAWLKTIDESASSPKK